MTSGKPPGTAEGGGLEVQNNMWCSIVTVKGKRRTGRDEVLVKSVLYCVEAVIRRLLSSHLDLTGPYDLQLSHCARSLGALKLALAWLRFSPEAVQKDLDSHARNQISGLYAPVGMGERMTDSQKLGSTYGK